MPQREDWPIHMHVVGAGSQEQADEALRRFKIALRAAGYSDEDEKTLAVALAANTYRATLLVYGDGAELWIIEKMTGGFPPQNWSLAQWRSRLHSTPCGTCGHKSEDTIIECRCACHDIFAGILNSEE